MKRTALVAAVLLGCVGCSNRPVTNTPRTALEQLLLSSAVDKALEKFRLPQLADSKVYVDFTNLKAYDQEYIRVATRARIARMGALLLESAEGADYIVEVASGGLGTEHKTGVVGMPPLPVPNSPLSTPEAPAYRSSEQTGIFKLMIFVHANGKFVAAHHYYAKADREEKSVLWWRFQLDDDIREGWDRAEEQNAPAEPAR